MGMDKYVHLTFHDRSNYLSMLGLQLDYIGKRAPQTKLSKQWIKRNYFTDFCSLNHLHKYPHRYDLTHWGRVTHIWVSKLTIIGSDNGFSPRRRRAIIWTNAEILLIGPLGTNFNEILIEILIFSFMKMRLKVSHAKWRPFCLGLNM